MSDLEPSRRSDLSIDARRQLLATADRLDALVGSPPPKNGLRLPQKPLSVRTVASLDRKGWLVAWADGVVEHLNLKLEYVDSQQLFVHAIAASADGEHAVALGVQSLLRWNAADGFTREDANPPARLRGRAVLSPDGLVLATIEGEHLVRRGKYAHVETWPLPPAVAGKSVLLAGCVGSFVIGVVDGLEVWALGQDPGQLGTLEHKVFDCLLDGTDLLIVDEDAFWSIGLDDLIGERNRGERLGDAGTRGSVLGSRGETVATPKDAGEWGIFFSVQNADVNDIRVRGWPARARIAVSQYGLLLGHPSGLELLDSAGCRRRVRTSRPMVRISADGERVALSTGEDVLIFALDGACEHVVPAVGQVRTLANSGHVLACGGRVWSLAEDGTWVSQRHAHDGTPQLAWCTPDGMTAIVLGPKGLLTARGPEGELRWRRFIDGYKPPRLLVEITDRHLVFPIGDGYEVIRVADGSTRSSATGADGYTVHERAEPDVVMSRRGQRYRRLHLETLHVEEGALPFLVADDDLAAMNWRDRWYRVDRDNTVAEYVGDRTRSLGRAERLYVRSDGHIILGWEGLLRIIEPPHGGGDDPS